MPSLTLTRAVYLAVALISAASLLAETTLIRLLAVAFWYPIAYVILSLAMLGIAVGAICVLLSGRLAACRPHTVLCGAATAMGLAIAVGYPLWSLLPVSPTEVFIDPAQAGAVSALLILLALPFVCAGVFLGKIFSTCAAQAAGLYAADLGGAALGVAAYVVLISPLGGPGTLMVAAATAGLAALVLMSSGRRRSGLALALTLTAVLLAPRIERVCPLRVSADKSGGAGISVPLPARTRWSPSSAVSVVPAPRGWVLAIDGGSAMTFAPRRAGKVLWSGERDLRSLVYELAPKGSTAVIGSGGGLEVAAALDAGVSRILALEVDPAVNAVVSTELASGLGHLFSDAHVDLTTVEARAYLSGHDERYDSIVSFHTISNAALATGGLGLVENYLLTVEATRLLCAHLSADALLAISRPEAQVPRLVAMLRAALPERGDLGSRVVIVSDGNEVPAFMTLVLYKTSAWRAEQLARVKASGARLVYLPDGAGDGFDYYAPLLGGASGPSGEGDKLPYRPAVLTLATDDRPFFNLNRAWTELRWTDLASIMRSPTTLRLRLEDAPVVQLAVLALLLGTLLLAALVLLVTTLRLRRLRADRPELFVVRIFWRTGAYFGLIGFGFMATELVLVQMLTRLVGSPNTSLVCVLSTLLLGTGIGSLVGAGRMQLSAVRAAAMAAVGAVFVAVALSPLVDVSAALPGTERLGLAAACALGVGFSLGSAFSAGLRTLQRPQWVAWAWAVNGLTTVLATGANLLLASSLGLHLTALTAAGGYALAAVAARRL